MRVGPVVAGVTALAALVAGVTMVPAGGAPEASAASGLAPRSAPDGILGSFSALGAGANGVVRTIVIDDDSVYAGGEFTTPYPRIAAWSPTSGTPAWSPLGPGLNGDVKAVLVSGNRIYAGGQFDDTAGGSSFSRCDAGKPLSCVGVWDGTAWSPMGAGLNDLVTSLAIGPSGSVYAGGTFDDTGGVALGYFCTSGRPLQCMAQWDGTQWNPMSSGLDSAVLGLTSASGTLYAVGMFTAKVASWNGTGWSAVGGNSSSIVSAATQVDDTLYVGGQFTDIGAATVAANRMAAWDGTRWSALGTGMNGAVYAVAADDTHGLLYAGGNFAQAGGSSAARVAVWDLGLREWVPLQWSATPGGNGLNGYVAALAVDDSRLYVGGEFSALSGTAYQLCTSGGTLRCIAEWTWDPPQGSNSITASGGSQITITGEGFIGVPPSGGVQIGGTAVTYTRTSTTSITATAPAGVLTNAAITVDGVGGVGNVGTFSTYVPPPPPVYPPSAPTDATAAAGDARATVTWSAPSSSGSFPVTSYQVESIPAGGSCLSSTLTCDATGLTNGTSYIFRVRALNGAGWSDWSSPSNAVTPEAPPPPPTPSIVITGSRGEGNDARTVYVDGTAMHLASQQVQAWVRLAGQPAYRQGITVTVGSDSRFTWKRATGKKTYVYFVSGDVRSNRVIIPAV